jgi:dihydroneopterin aldolase
MADCIQVTGIRATGFHGVLDFERAEGQEFLVDVTMRVDTAAAAAADDLSLTVDYSAIAGLVHARIIGEPHQLIETLAHRIADDVAAVAGVLGVTVAVHKPHAPINVPFDDVIVTVTRGS